jgi:hypothetical protein
MPVSAMCGHDNIPDMRSQLLPDLSPYLERLRALPFVQRIDLRASNKVADAGEDARLALRTLKGRHDLVVEVKGLPLSRNAAQSLIARASRPPVGAWIVFSPYVSPPVGELLASHHIGFVDQAGNCHIAVGRDYLAHIEGRRPEHPARQGRGLGARSYQVLFALLARPLLVAAPIRSLADAAGVRKTAAADLLRRLKDEGLVLRDKAGLRIARPNVLMDRWVAGYADKLRPKLLVGRYRSAAKDPLAFEKHAEAALEGLHWAWGGATAGYRLTKHYRSVTTTLHVASPPATLQRQLNLLSAKDGPIVVLDVPGPQGLEGPIPHVAHPLLVYTELVLEGDERALEAAGEIRDGFLSHIG